MQKAKPVRIGPNMDFLLMRRKKERNIYYKQYYQFILKYNNLIGYFFLCRTINHLLQKLFKKKMHILFFDGTNKYIEPIHRKNRNIDKYMHIQTYKNLHRQDEPIKRT